MRDVELAYLGRVARLTAVELLLNAGAGLRVVRVPQNMDRLDRAPEHRQRLASRSEELAASRSSTTCAGVARLRSDAATRTSWSHCSSWERSARAVCQMTCPLPGP